MATASEIHKNKTADDDLPIIVIEPIKGWVPVNLHEVWDYRYMVYYLVVRTIRSTYQQTVLGPMWFVINSFISVVIYSVIFGVVADLPSDDVPYPLFTFAAFLPWTLFSSSLSNVTVSMSGAGMIRKVYFPRLIMPIVSIAKNFVSFTLSFLLLFVLMAYYGYAPSTNIVFLPFFLLLAIATALGVGLWFAPLDVRSRDVQQIMSYITRFWFYATPVVYTRNLMDEPLHSLVGFNPMTSVVEGFRWALLGIDSPPEPSLIFSSIAVIIVLYGGLLFFKRQEKYFVDLG